MIRKLMYCSIVNAAAIALVFSPYPIALAATSNSAQTPGDLLGNIMQGGDPHVNQSQGHRSFRFQPSLDLSPDFRSCLEMMRAQVAVKRGGIIGDLIRQATDNPQLQPHIPFLLKSLNLYSQFAEALTGLPTPTYEQLNESYDKILKMSDHDQANLAKRALIAIGHIESSSEIFQSSTPHHQLMDQILIPLKMMVLTARVEQAFQLHKELEDAHNAVPTWDSKSRPVGLEKELWDKKKEIEERFTRLEIKILVSTFFISFVSNLTWFYNSSFGMGSSGLRDNVLGWGMAATFATIPAVAALIIDAVFFHDGFVKKRFNKFLDSHLKTKSQFYNESLISDFSIAFQRFQLTHNSTELLELIKKTARLSMEEVKVENQDRFLMPFVEPIYRESHNLLRKEQNEISHLLKNAVFGVASNGTNWTQDGSGWSLPRLQKFKNLLETSLAKLSDKNNPMSLTESTKLKFDLSFEADKLKVISPIVDQLKIIKNLIGELKSSVANSWKALQQTPPQQAMDQHFELRLTTRMARLIELEAFVTQTDIQLAQISNLGEDLQEFHKAALELNHACGLGNEELCSPASLKLQVERVLGQLQITFGSVI